MSRAIQSASALSAAGPRSEQALSLVRQRWPRVYAALQRAAPLPVCQLEECGRVGAWSVDGIRLASAWNPGDEATLQCQHLDTTASEVTLFGIGMAHLPPLLLESLPATAHLRVVPLNLSLWRTLLTQVEMSDWLAHPRVSLALPEDITTLPADEHLVITTPMLSLAEATAEPLRDRLRQILESRHARRYQDRLAPVLDHNIRGNRPHSLRDPSIGTLFPGHGDALDGATCIVAGAGPSLDATLPAIAESVEHGACLVAVDAALLPLIRAGIVPHFVVSIDPLPGVAHFYETDLARLSGCAMVYFPSVDPDVVGRWPHQRFVAVSTHARYQRYPELHDVTQLFSSGSVIHPATDLAVRLGARNVCFAGADFGYPVIGTAAGNHTKGTDSASRPSHAAGAAVTSAAPEDTAVYLRDDNDRLMPSQPNLAGYLRDLEAYIAHRSGTGTLFSKLGRYGAAIAGAPPITEEP